MISAYIDYESNKKDGFLSLCGYILKIKIKKFYENFQSQSSMAGCGFNMW